MLCCVVLCCVVLCCVVLCCVVLCCAVLCWCIVTSQNANTESFYNANGTLQTRKVKALARTYAQAIAGLAGSVRMQFDAQTAVFNLRYGLPVPPHLPLLCCAIVRLTACVPGVCKPMQCLLAATPTTRRPQPRL